MCAQVVRGVDAFHTDMGGVLVVLHSSGVRLLPWPTGGPLPPRHRGPIRLPRRHRRPLLRRLPRLPLPSHGLRPQPHRSKVPIHFQSSKSFSAFFNLSLMFLLDLQFFRYLKSRFTVDMLGCLPWDAIFKVFSFDFTLVLS